ncbi:MAG: hypothetical protein GY723_03775 [bacterium]|nr:hypothetical protein [bacterium]MCP5069255.1 hypothetical protein [bacterium]
MAISLVLDHENAIGTAICTGSLTLDQLSGYLDEWAASGCYYYDELFIGLGIDLADFSFADLLKHAGRAEPFKAMCPKGGRNAFVLDDGPAKQMGEFWAAAIRVGATTGERRVFSTEVEARAWLAGPRSH